MLIWFITNSFIFIRFVELKITELYGYSLLVVLYEQLSANNLCLTLVAAEQYLNKKQINTQA